MRIASVLLLSATLSSAYQVIQSGSGAKNGIGFRYETRLEPRIEGQKVSGFSGGGIIVDENFHRYLHDDATRRYIGYDLSITKRGDGTHSVTLGQLSPSTEKLGLKGEWTQIPLAVNSTPQVIRSGDEITIEIFTNPATGQKIVEHLFFDDTPGVIRLPEGAPRDYTINDVPLVLAHPKILLNGNLLTATSTGMSGEAVYFYVPGRGRFAMSLAPNLELGFRNLGEARGSRITFQVGHDTWVLDCKSPVAPGGGVFNLYVYPDPAWRPPSGADTWQLGASSARSMVRK